jgi:hypothetical protein
LKNIGLMDLGLVFAREGKVLKVLIPTRHTGESRAAQPYCPDVTAITLPSNEWYSETFQGGYIDEEAGIRHCDEIYMIAESHSGTEYRFPTFCNGITETEYM